jgi:acetyl esterase/lipase
MSSVPWGGLFFGVATLRAVAPQRRPRPLAIASWALGGVVNELTFVYLAIVVGSAAVEMIDGDPTSGGGLSLALALVTVVGLVIVLRRALWARAALDRALSDALGAGWRSGAGAVMRRRRPWARILLAPLPFRPHSVERLSNIPYGEHGEANLLDVYRRRSRPVGAPTLIHLHGGHFRWGRKSREARPLLHHLARHGWVCISANYRLSRTPAQGFPGHLVDVKRLIAWVRANGPTYGADPETIVLTGSSSGAHLTAMAALTAGAPELQPGFEDVDTSITAGVGLYGYYGHLGGDDRPSSDPLDHVRPDAPPFLAVHGVDDTYTPVDGARHFTAGLRAVSSSPVVLAELPGAQHSFDVFHSIRFESVVDPVAAFAEWARSAREGRPVTDQTQRAP